MFMLVERTAIEYCRAANRIERDLELNRLYRKLVRHPEGDDGHPLYSYLQAAFRLYLSVTDTSRSEFEGVARRLAKSAKTFSKGPTSTNYYRVVSEHIG